MARPITVLALDGGGIRGIIPAIVMAEIERRTRRRIATLFDYVAGTSTGGVLALALTMPVEPGGRVPRYRALEGVDLYRKNAGRIFAPRHVTGALNRVRELVDEKYDSRGVESVLQEYMAPNLYLADALTNVVITAYEIEFGMPWFFRSARARQDADYNFPAWQVARATSAAPTYFEPARLDAKNGAYWSLVDGGVFANNPTLCAYMEVLNEHPGEDVLLVSIGTGRSAPTVSHQVAADWGMIGWVRPVIDILMHGVNETVHYQMKRLLNRPLDHRADYFRFDVDLPPGGKKLDDIAPETLDLYETLGQRILLQQDRDLDILCERLKA